MDDALSGQRVFALQPHASGYIAKPDSLFPVPANISDERAAMLASAETAVNLVQDAAPIIGERVLVLGLGIIGQLVTTLASGIPGVQVTAVDPLMLRLEQAESLGATSILHPDDAGFARGRPSGQMLVRGWFRHLDDEPIDALGLLQATDAYPPTIFNADLPVAWTPTVELTAHVRARPAPGWLRCAFTTRFVTGGFLEEDGVVWDETGTLVAQSRQLALVPRPG